MIGEIGEAATQAWDAAHKWLAEQPERPAEAPVEVTPEGGGGRDIFTSVEEIRSSASQAWTNAQTWMARHGEDSDETTTTESSEGLDVEPS